MRRIITIISFCLILTAVLSVAILAQNTLNNIEVLFSSDSVFTEEEKEIIENHFTGEESTMQPYGIKCILFGHDYKTEIIDVIHHKVRSTRPRCVRETYETKICEDCSDTVSTLIATTVIDCCQ